MIFHKIRQGLLDHFQDGNLNLREDGCIYLYLLLRANILTGTIYPTNARAIARDIHTDEKDVRRDLRRLVKKGYIKRFFAKGQQKKHAILINNHEIINTDQNGTSKLFNKGRILSKGSLHGDNNSLDSIKLAIIWDSKSFLKEHLKRNGLFNDPINAQLRNTSSTTKGLFHGDSNTLSTKELEQKINTKWLLTGSKHDTKSPHSEYYLVSIKELKELKNLEFKELLSPISPREKKEKTNLKRDTNYSYNLSGAEATADSLPPESLPSNMLNRLLGTDPLPDNKQPNEPESHIIPDDPFDV